MDINMIRNEPRNRFEAEVDGELCVVDYRLDDSVLTIDHVVVPKPVGGRGIAGALTRFALDTARREGWGVVANCSYAAAWIARHPEYQDLLRRT